MKVKRLCVELTPEEHHKFKMLAARRDKSMKDTVLELLDIGDVERGFRIVYAHAMDEKEIARLEKQEGKDIWQIVDPYAEEMTVKLMNLLKKED